jgi:hypothetical protein
LKTFTVDLATTERLAAKLFQSTSADETVLVPRAEFTRARMSSASLRWSEGDPRRRIIDAPRGYQREGG